LKYASQYLGINYPLDELTLPGITYADYDTFMHLYSLSLKEMKQRLTAERKLDDTFMYQFHALQSHPLILTELNGCHSESCVKRKSCSSLRGPDACLLPNNLALLAEARIR